MKSAIATVALLSSVANAITFTTPTDLHSASEATITWTTDASDPSTWSLFLVNTIFHNNFAIANPVNNSAGTLTLTLPAVPIEDGYTLQATQIGNNSQVFATSPTFAIAAPLSSSAVPSSTAASSASGSAVVSGSGTSAAVTSLPSGSSAAITGSASRAPSAASGSASGSATGSSSGLGASPTNFNGAASVSSNVASWVAAAFAVAAGAIAF